MKEELNLILKKSLCKDYVSLEIAKFKILGVINATINRLEITGIEFEKDFWNELNLIERLYNCSTVNELRNETSEILAKLDQYAKKYNKKNENTQLFERAIDYIEKNYHNKQLNVSMIAEHFGVSVTYLSIYFKKQVGIGILEYIHNVRINKAKVMLRNQEMTIKDISMNIGYWHSDTFIRNFKKYTGITPGQYKVKLL